MSGQARLSPWLLAGAIALASAPFAFLHPVRIQGRSMEPRLRDGDLSLVLRAWCAGPPSPGEIWLIQTPTGPAVKRLVALPASRVEILDGDLLVQGQLIPEPYVAHPERASAGPWNTGGGYFLLGDNRPESHDSRAWGPLGQGQLEGRLWDR